LANLHSDTHDFAAAAKEYEKALEIYRELAESNPSAFLPDVAMTLNNLANLHSDTHDFASAAKEYEEALEIRRELAASNPSAFLPNVAVTLINLSIFYLESVPDKEKSVNLAKKALGILLPIYKQSPQWEEYLNAAKQVLEANGINSSNNENGILV
jgi:tetratricopeptide (TPR) repeat protein